jgi:hypothetical protein
MTDLAGGIRMVIHDGNDPALSARLTVHHIVDEKKKKESSSVRASIERNSTCR